MTTEKDDQLEMPLRRQVSRTAWAIVQDGHALCLTTLYAQKATVDDHLTRYYARDQNTFQIIKVQITEIPPEEWDT